MNCSDNLEEELRDGVILHALLTACNPGQVLPKIAPKPKVVIQKMENVTKLLKWMQQAGIKLVATGTEDIYGGKTKYVLGMVWKLILYYQLDSTEDEEELGLSLRSALLEWCNNVLQPQGITVKNFTENWKDGRAFCGLVNALQPNTIPLSECNPENAVTNLNRAFNKAHDLFKFPKMLEAEDLVQVQDELSIITYVSYFRGYLSKNAAHAASTYAEGPGLKEALTFKPAHFTIFACDNDGKRVNRGGAYIRVCLKDLNSGKECGKYSIKDHLDGTYSCTYETENFGTKGTFELQVKVGSAHVKDSPFHPEIIPGEADPSKCVAFGPGVEFAKAGEKTEFTVQTKDLKGDPLTKGGTTIIATLKGATGGEIPVTIVDNNNGTYTCSYQTENATQLKLDIWAKTEAFGTCAIAGSPYTVKVGPGLASAENTKVSGLENAKAGVKTSFQVTSFDRYGNAVKEGGAPISGEVVCGNVKTPIQVVDNGNGTYTLNYVPQKAGDNHVTVKIGDHLVKGAPFTVKVDPGEVSINNTEITFLDHPLAGLSGATLHTMDEQHNLMHTGGAHVVAECTPLSTVSVLANDNGDGTYEIVFPPNSRGKYRVKVKVNGNPTPKGPWEVAVKENPLNEDGKKKVANLLPKSSVVLNRLLAKTTDKERTVILEELSAFRK